jgi:hypothetical protein
LNAQQLLFYQAPLSGVLLAVLVPFFEPVFGANSLFDPDRTFNEWVNLANIRVVLLLFLFSAA